MWQTQLNLNEKVLLAHINMYRLLTVTGCPVALKDLYSPRMWWRGKAILCFEQSYQTPNARRAVKMFSHKIKNVISDKWINSFFNAEFFVGPQINQSSKEILSMFFYLLSKTTYNYVIQSLYPWLAILTTCLMFLGKSLIDWTFFLFSTNMEKFGEACCLMTEVLLYAFVVVLRDE